MLRSFAPIPRLAIFFTAVCCCYHVDAALNAQPMTGPVPVLHHSLPDAFLPTNLQTVSDLVQKVQSDPKARMQYARYLHVPEHRVAAYLRANVVATRLTKTGKYTVFFVRPNGLIYPVMMKVPQGTTVFAMRNGGPLLTGEGGRPLKAYGTAVETRTYVANVPRPVVVKVAPIQEVLVPSNVTQTVAPTIVEAPEYRPAPGPTGSH